MVFGISRGEPSEDFSDNMKELKNHVKLFELDMEKRLILLENSISSVQKSMGAIGQFESAKDAVMQIEEIKKTLREVEDTNLISKLEGISSSDKIASISESVDMLSGKIKLLSEAVDTLSESKPDVGTVSSADTGKDLLEMKSEIGYIKSALSKVSSSITAPEKVSEIIARVDSLEAAGSSVNSELKKMYEAYNEKIGMLERRISAVSSPSGISEKVSKDISGLKDEVERLKGISKKLVEMIEIDSKTLKELKGVRDESTAYNGMAAKVSELSKKMSDVEREMNLDRAMYPKNIMNLEKDLANMKSAYRNLADAIESVAKMNKSGAENAMRVKKDADLQKSLNEISSRLTEISSLKEKIGVFEKEVMKINADNAKIHGALGTYDAKISAAQKTSGNYAENKLVAIEKSVQDLSASISRLSGSKKEMSDFEKEIISVKNEIESGNRRMQELARELEAIKMPDATIKQLSEKIKKAEDLKNTLKTGHSHDELERVLSSLAEENKVLRQEIEQLKQICAEIMKETREQPIIID